MKFHMSVGIYGLEERLHGHIKARWDILVHSDGTTLTRKEVEEEIARCKSLGYKVIPTCENIDERGFCKGHEESEGV